MLTDRPQFERLALEHLDTLARVARCLTDQPAEADDLVQETYLRALRSGDGIEGQPYSARVWLLRALHNTHSARAGRDGVRLSGGGERAPADDRGAAQGDAAAFDFAAVPDDVLAGAMEHLSAELRVALVLWAVEEMSVQEIADATCVP